MALVVTYGGPPAEALVTWPELGLRRLPWGAPHRLALARALVLLSQKAAAD